ncbi:MAG: TrkA family potassium uptake protein, partial [Clostridiales bacterium]|nr:TrkA family potassium uptake protein [Clostridiales bacterium]
SDYVIVYLPCPKDWLGKTLQQVDVRKRFQVSVLAIYRKDDMIMDLRADTRLEKGDSLLVLGHREDVERVEALG